MDIYPFLPQSYGLRFVGLRIEQDHVILGLITTAGQACCPVCGQPSARVHSHYHRTLADLPWMGTAVRLHLQVRRFFCATATCPQRVFCERVAMAAAYARRTLRSAQALVQFGLTAGGEAGTRLSRLLPMAASGDSILRLIRRQPVPDSSPVAVLGVDDWAWRKGQRYGTILCDLEQHRVVDLLPERSAEALAGWLQNQPAVRVVSRDRGGYYAQGALRGAPQACQVADRFHLLCNLRQALVRLLDRHTVEVHEAAGMGLRPAPPGPECQACVAVKTTSRPPPQAQQAQAASRMRRQERYQQVVALHEQGLSIRQIARQMGMHRQTVRRFLNAGQFPERATRRYARRTDTFVDYLRQRWQEGCRNARQLAGELKLRGFGGSYDIVRRCVAGWRGVDDPLTKGPKPRPHQRQPIWRPSSREVSWLLWGHTEDISTVEKAFLDRLYERCPEIKLAAEMAQAFSDMVTQRQVEQLEDWLVKARSPDYPRELRLFADGLAKDADAVKAALSLPWSNGPVEGQINRLKLIKRQMYGRAGFDLLRRRVLYTG